MEVHYERVALKGAKRQLKPIHKKYLAKGNNREIYNSVSDSSNLEYFIDFGLPIELDIYSFLKDIYQLALIGVFNFTAYYKCLSIKNLGLTPSEHMHYLAPFQLKLYLNYKKIKKYRWMDINNIFTDEIAFVNKKKKREFDKLFKNHCYFCLQLFSYLYRKIENNLEKLTNEDFVKMISFFKEKKRDFEQDLIDYSFIKSNHPKKKFHYMFVIKFLK